jgi:formylglycine-generating enzyme required for sulfatase activity
MFPRKHFRCVAVFTLFIFTCFIWDLEFGYSQEENPLLKAQGLYKQGNFIEAVKVLEAFSERIRDNPNERKRLAEARLLLARIYYDAGEDAKVTEYMEQAVEAYIDIGKEEGNLDFKSRLELVREQRLKANAEDKKAATTVPTGTEKAAAEQPIVHEQEKPAAQLKKKKKFPWLLTLVGIGVVVILIVVLKKKKKQTLIVTVGEGVAGNPMAGSYIFKKGESISYFYSLSSESYKDLTVLLDGTKAPASGSIIMDSDHTLFVSATKIEATYTNGVLTVAGIRYELAPIPAGTFKMGSNSLEAYLDEGPLHTVRISNWFRMGKTEVTQGLWQAVMGSNPSYFKNGDNYPVEQVSWDNCQAFLQKLNQLLGENVFRLPTEAEWEYACRAGTTGDRYGDLDAVSWYNGNSGGSTHLVGQKQANAFGLKDTLGNVMEWCQDWYGPYVAGYQVNPTGPISGVFRVYRGGSWGRDARLVRCANRSNATTDYFHSSLGFRLAANR